MDTKNQPKYPSPCVRNCCLDKKDICVGCHRSIDEIIQWSSLNDEQKKIILNKIKKIADDLPSW